MVASSSKDVIGVFGYSCSLPGCEDFRALLMGHETGIRPHAPDSQNFDHVFFGAPKQAAEKCDPQLRRLLECTYHALLRSAIGEQELEHRREKVGVYVGSCSSDYMGILCGTACAESEGITGNENLGAQRAMFANRISEVFDLQGPSMSIDTTCSSGLTALVSACEAIERGEIDLAVVGASSVLLDSSVTDAYSRLGMLSSGECLPFCKGADGYVRAEGTVVLVIGSILSASSAARAHIVGFGCNSNGGCKATPITAPSVEMQVRLCRRVLAQARLRPNSVDYVECHATGTQKGDAAECEALERVFFSKGDTTKCEASVTRRCPLLLGAVKGTTGHTEAASGLVGVLRVILSMESGMFARNRHYAHENRNPNIQLLEDPTVAKVVEENTPISADGDIVALVSAFSFGGSNAQVLLRSGSFNKRGETSWINDDEKWKSINAVCGRTETTVRKSLEFLSSTNRQYEGLLEPPPLQRVQSPAFAVRGFSVGKDVYLREPCQIRGREKKRPIVLLFSGNGQDIDMDVLRHQSSQSRVWCETWARCRQHVLSAYRLDLDLYNRNDSEAHDSHDHIVLSTLVLVALQICQVEWLREVAVEVSFYLGHSSGEIPMAYADGVLTLEQALSVAYLRVEHALRAKAHALEPHCMLALGLSVREFQECDGAEGVEVACENSEHLITIAGRKSLVDGFLEKLAFNPPPRKVHHKFLNTGGIAYHSAFVDGVLEELERDLRLLVPHPREASTKWVSTCPISGNGGPRRTIGAEYYCRNIRGRVEFFQACQRIPDAAVVVELGATKMFAGCVKRTVPHVDFLAFFGDDQGQQKPRSIPNHLQLLYGQLFLRDAVPELRSGGREDLHATALLRAFPENLAPLDHSSAVRVFQRVPLVTQASTAIPDSAKWTVTFDLAAKHAWLREHVVQRAAILPGAALVYAISRKLTERLGAGKSVELRELTFHRPVVISEDWDHVDVQIRVLETKGCCEAFCPAGSDAAVASCEYSFTPRQTVSPMSPPRMIHGFSEHFYDQMLQRGYGYGKTFQVVSMSDEHSASLTLRHCDEAGFYVLCLDGMLQLGVLSSSASGETVLPHKIRRLSINMDAFSSQQHIWKATTDANSAGGVSIFTNVAEVVGLKVYEETSRMLLLVACQRVRKPVLEVLTAPNEDAPQTQDFSLCFLPREDFEKGMPSTARIREFISDAQQTSLFLVSDVPGFCGFVKSLTTEPGYEWLHGIQVSNLGLRKVDDLLDILPAKLRAINNHISFCAPSGKPHLSFSTACGRRERQDRASVIHTSILLHYNAETGRFYREVDLKREEPAQYAAPHGRYLVRAETSGYRFKALPAHSDDGGSAASQQAVRVCFSALNYRDVMLASGFISKRSLLGVARKSKSAGLGMEFAGVDGCGRNCIGIANNAIATHIGAEDVVMKWVLPEFPSCDGGWAKSDEDAATNGFRTRDAILQNYATIPVVYATSYYALILRCFMQKTDKILIHAGTGGVGIAALNICLNRLEDPSSQIFVTCHPDKQCHLLDAYPQLRKENISSDRDTAFLRDFHGTKFDIVLNSLAGRLLKAGLELLARGGRFVELGKRDIEHDTTISMSSLQKESEFHVVDLDQALEDENTRNDIFALIESGLSTMEVKPIPHKVFDCSEIEQAFAHMRSNARVGKVLLKMSSAGQRGADLTVPTADIPHYDSSRDTALIIGGFGGFGVHLARWLVQKGCRDLILLGRSAEQGRQVRDDLCRLQHVSLKTYSHDDYDFTVYENVTKFFRDPAHQRLTHIFNLAAHTADRLFDNQTLDDWQNVLLPKVTITRNVCDALAETSAQGDVHLSTTNLKFIVFSSVVSGSMGNAGQTHYGFANAYMDDLIRERCESGLHGVSLQWGIIRNVGLAAKDAVSARLRSQVSEQEVGASLDELEKILALDATGVFSIYSPPKSVLSAVMRGNDLLTNCCAGEPENDVEKLVETLRSKFVYAADRSVDDRRLEDIPLNSIEVIQMHQFLKGQCRDPNRFPFSPDDLYDTTLKQLATVVQDINATAAPEKREETGESERELKESSGREDFGNSSSGAISPVSCVSKGLIASLQSSEDSAEVQESCEDVDQCGTVDSSIDVEGQGKSERQVIGIMATYQRKTLLRERSLPSVLAQTRPLDALLIVSDDHDTDQPTTEEDVREICDEHRGRHATMPEVVFLKNVRTRHRSWAGPWNTALRFAFAKFGQRCWIAGLDDDDEWHANHIEACLGAAAKCSDCKVVASELRWVRPEMVVNRHGMQEETWVEHPCPVPQSLPKCEDFLLRSGIQGSNVFVDCEILLKSGAGDEACASAADKNLMIRIVDLLSAEGGQYTTTNQKTVTHYAENDRHRVSNPGSSRMMDGVRYFFYKFEHRMSAETKLQYCDRVKTKLGCEIDFTGDDEYKAIPKPVDLVTRGGDAVSVAEGTKQALERASEAGSNPDYTESLDTSMKCLFGIITSNTERLQPLLDDIATLASVSVVVFANVAPERSDVVVAKIEAAFSMRNISGLVIRPQDPVVRFVLESYVVEDNSSNEFPLHIAQSRTVLQTFMRGVAHGAHATLDCKFSTYVVLDDDKRLLQGWDARTVECDANTILLGQDIKCAPNTVVNAMRTQLLDFLFLHDRRHFGREAEGNGPPLRAKPFDSPFDQYFDLSTSRFDHLERPFLLDQGPPGDEDSSEAAFIARCRSKILRGDPLSGRDAVPVFEGASTQRGGLMVVSNPDFLQLQQSSPRIRVTSGREAFVPTRRSDTLFCQVHARQPQVTCLVKRRLAVLHCSSNNTVSSPEQLRLLEVQEILGAMVCRRPEDRPAFVSDRLLSLRLNVLRIRGIVETLRKRPEGHQSAELHDFLSELDDLFDPQKWNEEVYSVIEREAVALRDWVPQPVSVPLFEDIPREALKKLCLAHCASTLTLPDTASPNAHGSLIGPAVLTLVRSLRKVGASKPDLSPDDLLPLRTDSVPCLSRSDRRFTESEHDEFFDVTCKRAFLCARFIRWWTECNHSRRNLRDMLNRLPENELSGYDKFQTLVREQSSPEERREACHAKHDRRLHLDSKVSDVEVVAQVEELFAQAQAGEHVCVTVGDPFLVPSCEGTGDTSLCSVQEAQGLRRSLHFLRRILRRAGFVVTAEHAQEWVDEVRFETSVENYVFSLQKPETWTAPRRVALMIKTCPQDYETILPCVRHIVHTLEGKSCFEEIVLVNDCSRTVRFLRQFAHADLSKLDAALEQIQAERLVDRVVHFDGNPELAKRVNERWFGVSDHVGTHSEEGAQYASTFYAFDEIRSDIILQCDSDIIFRVSDGHDMDLVQECAEFMEEEEECLTVGVPIVMRNPVPLGYRHVGMRKERNQVRTFPVEVRCSFIHRDRLLHLLPLKIPDHARGAGDFLINKNLEGWYRVLDVILRDSNWKIRSYRGSLGHGHTGFVHVPNEVKCDSSKYMFIKDRVANTTIRTRTPERRPGICPSTNAEVDARWQQQLDNVELQDTNWLGERDEDIVFVCCGRNLSVGRVLRCLESLARQTRGKVSCTTREANGAPSAGSSTSMDDSTGSLPEERDITCGIVVLDDATDNYEDIRDYIFDKARAMFGPEHVTCVNSGIRNGYMRNTDHMIRHVCTNPKSVVVTLDLDDMLLGTRVVSLLTSLFFPADEVECAIGGMIRNDKCKHYPLDAKSPRQARGGGNTWQHLRAFKKELFDNIPVEHLKDVEGKWFQIACDWAFMIPVVEQAKATRFIDSADEGPLYLYEPCLPYGSSKDVVQAAAIEGKISSVASLLQQAATFQSRRARRYHETALPSKFLSEKARCRVFPKNERGDEIVLYYKGNVTQDAHVPVRIHSECLSGDILGSYKCDCGPQLQSFLEHIEEEGCGVLVYIKGHEGRGAGLFNKIGAYQMMDEQPSLHHIRALKLFNCESDTRNYADAVYALEQLGVHRIRLHTNNPLKLEAVKRVFVGQDCVLQQEVPSVSTSFNKKYLMEKVQDCQHRGLLLWLDTMPSTDGSDDSVDTANVGTQGSSRTESYSPHRSASPQEDSSCQEASTSTIPASVEARAQKVNTQSFEVHDPCAKIFYDEHGWVVIRNILPTPLRSDMLEQLEDHKRRCAEALGRDYDQYKNEISQHRDLHLLGGALKEAIYGEKGCPLNRTIMAITGWSGCKLFHDHVINKPRFGSNSSIPAHQDSMFWPVDRPGVSCLAALEPVETTGGCLEVIDQSHRYGCDEPVDFMAPEVGFSELHPSLTQYKLPLEAGSAVLLNSLTYHRSSPNEAVMTSQEPCTQRTGDRPVHLSLWVPPCTKWRPDLVDWHPVNDHLTNLQPGALMQHESRHPWFGTCVELPDAAPLHCGTRYSHEGITMYNASKKTAAQLREILGDADPVASVSAMLSDEESATRIFQRLCDTAVCNPSQKQEVLGVLERLRICTEAYEKIRARNVFNEAYAVWWKLVGEKWETRVDFDTPLSNEEVRSYLERIGVVFRTTADLNLLTEIVQKTLAVIPFQNFSMLTNPLVRPTKVQIVSAMVTGIGGLCNVRNPFLFLLLKTLGFDVSFISCTICDAPHGKELPDAHIALLVNIASNTYWVDVGNGYPYVKPLEINGLESDAPDCISHDFVNVRIVAESSSGTEGRIYAVQHRRCGTSEWRTNNFFRASPVSYVHFDKLHYGHYNPSKDFEGPFLSGLRFNMWSADRGSYIKLVDRYVMLRSREPTRNADKEVESLAEFEAVMGNFLRSQVDADVIDKFLSLAHKAWNVTLCRKAGWPVGKFSSALWDPRVESLVDSKPIAVILTTGAMNPGHKGHVHVVKEAQKRLIAAGYKVVGSWISPSNEEYLKEKFAHEEGVILPASLRLELLEEMTRTEPTIEVGRWEVENLRSEGACQYFKFPEVCQKLGEFLRANSIFSCGGSHLSVFYACGADLANRRNLWNGLRLKSNSSVSLGVVVVPRGGEPLGNESKSVYVAGCSLGESVEVSSTSVREALQKVENPSCFHAERDLHVALGHTASKMLLRSRS